MEVYVMQYLKAILLVALGVIYFIVPDLIPGPIDDIIVLIITGGLAKKSIEKK